MLHTYILIMSGGEGTRFAPLSTTECPKQFLNFLGEGTFIQQTYRRARNLVPAEQIFVATNERYLPLVKGQLSHVPEANLIGEPLKKNTAPALAYAAGLIHSRDPEAIMLCLPSDHYISNEAEFAEVLRKAVSLAAKGYLVTLGMKPTWASSDYGYIAPSRQASAWSEVERFIEKPDKAAAERYISAGYFWNGGIFAWRTEFFLEEIGKHAPEIHPDGFKGESSKLKEKVFHFSASSYFSSVPSISIDYALMEKSDKVAVIPADIGWSDVGTWEGLYRLHTQNNVCVSPEVVRIMNRVVLPRRVDKPWGYEEIWAHTNDYVGKMLFIKKEHRLSYQYHEVKEETVRILEGIMDLEFELSGERRVTRMNPGDIFHISPEMRHRMIAVEDCRVLEVSTPELNDVVRVEDDYGR